MNCHWKISKAGWMICVDRRRRQGEFTPPLFLLAISEISMEKHIVLGGVLFL